MSRTEKLLLLGACLVMATSLVNALWPSEAQATLPLPPAHQTMLAQGAAGLTYVHAFGTPTRTGTVTSTGTSATSTVSAGVPLKVVCDAWAHLGVRSSCSRDITNSAYCEKVLSENEGGAFYVHPNGATLAIISADAGTVNCSKFEMK